MGTEPSKQRAQNQRKEVQRLEVGVWVLRMALQEQPLREEEGKET